eukprot:jgi/Tetstr1/441739/TSEL_029962.t1
MTQAPVVGASPPAKDETGKPSQGRGSGTKLLGGRVDLGDREVDTQDLTMDQLVALVEEYRDKCNMWLSPPEGTVLAHDYEPKKSAVEKEVDELGALLEAIQTQENLSAAQVKALATFKDIRPSMDVVADVESGEPLRHTEALAEQERWRARTIQTYGVDHYGRGDLEILRKRPFFKDYRHYKYYGYGGRGAVTAWGRNRKGAVCQDYDPQAALYPEQHKRDAAIDLEMVVNPHRPDERPTLTPARRKLLAQFSEHNTGRAPSRPLSRGSSGELSGKSSLRRATAAEKIARQVLGVGPCGSASSRRPSPREPSEPVVVELDSARPLAQLMRKAAGATSKVLAHDELRRSAGDGQRSSDSADGARPGSSSGGGRRAFHQRYPHYKYKAATRGSRVNRFGECK